VIDVDDFAAVAASYEWPAKRAYLNAHCFRNVQPVQQTVSSPVSNVNNSDAAVFLRHAGSFRGVGISSDFHVGLLHCAQPDIPLLPLCMNLNLDGRRTLVASEPERFMNVVDAQIVRDHRAQRVALACKQIVGECRYSRSNSEDESSVP
jgi:hypothetical protein